METKPEFKVVAWKDLHGIETLSWSWTRTATTAVFIHPNTKQSPPPRRWPRPQPRNRRRPRNECLPHLHRDFRRRRDRPHVRRFSKSAKSQTANRRTAMPRTSKQVLAEQQKQADAARERRAEPKLPAVNDATLPAAPDATRERLLNEVAPS